MRAKHYESTDDDKHAAKAARGWVSEAIGFDSRIPAAQAKRGSEPEEFKYEKVSVEEARMARNASGRTAAPGFSLRSPRRPEVLQDATIHWLSRLPEKLRPMNLSRQFPRIANRLSGLWADPVQRNRYLTELLMDTRDGTREGFPMAVAAELATLFAGVDATAKGLPWGQIKNIR